MDTNYALVTFTLKAPVPLYLVAQVPCTFHDVKGSWLDGMPTFSEGTYITNAIESISNYSRLVPFDDYEFNSIQYFNNGVEVNMEGVTN